MRKIFVLSACLPIFSPPVDSFVGCVLALVCTGLNADVCDDDREEVNELQTLAVLR